MDKIISLKNALLGKTARHLWLLERDLRAADAQVRMAAVRELATVDDPRANTLLLGALSDTDGWVRQRAVQGLGSDSASVMALCGALDDAWARPMAARVLGSLGDVRAVKPLIRALNMPEKGALPVIIEALAELGDARAVPALIVAAREGSAWVSEAAELALKALGGAEGVYRRAA